MILSARYENAYKNLSSLKFVKERKERDAELDCFFLKMNIQPVNAIYLKTFLFSFFANAASKDKKF